MKHRLLLLCVYFFTFIYMSNGCAMEGVTQWLAPQHVEIKDIHAGIVVSRTTTNIDGIISTDFSEGHNRGPYLAISLEDSVYTITTTDAFATYEEYETLETITVRTNFRCTEGHNRQLIFTIFIQDTNNHSPIFKPTDVYDFSLALPVPPGFLVTGCDKLIVRDVDLTTKQIDFEMEDNPYFEIAYYDQIQSKEFGAIIKTKTLIRSLPDTLSLAITATDVDLTGDEPRTSRATVNIQADNMFTLPEEPIFSQAFYTADYTADHNIVLRENILLQQGYDDQVQFDFDGEYADNFELIVNGNLLSFRVTKHLPEDVSQDQLLLVVRATRQYTSGATATVVIIPPKARMLGFEAPYYSGSLENNVLTLDTIVLTTGYDEDVEYSLSGEFATYFTLSNIQNRVTISVRTEVPENVILENSALLLTLSASGLNAITATTNVLLDVIKDDHITPMFEKAVYSGSYDSATGITLEEIILVQGYDSTVEVSLLGDHSELLTINHEDGKIRVSGTIPAEIWPKQTLFLVLQATKPRTVVANAAIKITLPTARVISFEASTYIGSIRDNSLTIEEIVLGVGYSTDVEFTIIGEYADHFSSSNTDNKVIINMDEPLPENVILENNFIALTLSASGLNAITTFTTVLLEIKKDDTTTPVFSQNIYNGIYKDSSNVNIESVSLIQGYDSSVSFRLDGDHAQYFDINNVENDIKITLKSTIPADLIFDEKVLLFKVLAEKDLTVGASSIVAIQFPSELTEPTVMRFSKDAYLGTLENDIFKVTDNIVLEYGFGTETLFSLSGEYAEHFALTNSENVITISMRDSAPVEEMSKNNFIILQIQASQERAVSVTASLVIDVMTPDAIVFPVFEESFYSGTYTKDDGLHFEQEIRLEAGFDDTVTFALEGDYSKWFALQENGNSVLVILNTNEEIPSDVIELNHQLLFTVVAKKPGTSGGRSAISISLPKDPTEQVILRFEENSYVGQIEDGKLLLSPISLNKNTETVNFKITGEYADYFDVVKDTTQITIKLKSELPTDIESSFIILNIEASHDEAISGHTTVVLELKKDIEAVIIPVFEKAYYIGEYAEETGLRFDNTISLLQGFDDSVTFTLEGDDSQGFILKQETPNNIIISLDEENLPDFNNRNHLTFTIIANKPDSLSGRSVIIIHLTDFSTDRYLRFTDDYFKGFIEDGILNLDVITLKEGYSEEVNFALTGDYIDYFQLTNVDGKITLRLTSELPPTINTNILILTLEARTENIRTHATIIIERIIPALIFEQPYYTGSYTEENGLNFGSLISLNNEIDDTIQLSLIGDHSAWFGLDRRSENSIALTLLSPIPSAVLANNQKLIFIIEATRLNSDVVARATVVISLIDEITSDLILGFEQVSYSGTIEDNTLSLEPIILVEGFTEQVSFALLGDLAPYFSLARDGPTVRISLRSAIPEDIVPINRIVILALRASGPQALPAFATIVLAVERTETAVEQLAFAETYYTGLYTEQAGLNFEQHFSLARGYDDTVEFALVGEHSAWFGLDKRSENSIALTLLSPIPSAVLANNQKLIFIIEATRPNSDVVARATVVISLIDEVTSDLILGFEQVSYSGTIEDNTLSLEPIILVEGFTEQVSFALLGDLASYFSLARDGPTVRISLRSAIPEDIIPTNRIVILALRASGPQALPAFATIVLAVERTETVVEQLAFAETYYTGLYTEQAGLNFEQHFSLARGYDDTVEFALVGEHSAWFRLDRRSENSIALTLLSPIPSAVLANNQKLIFIIEATRLNSDVVARATVVISLIDEITSDLILGFEQVSYSGTIEDNTLSLEPIILVEGFTEQVSFALLGDLASYFSLSRDGPTVRISLRSAIPEDIIPTNRIVILALRASGPQALPAFATIVLAVERTETAVEQLAFAETYYTGLYTEQAGLNFEQHFSLARGYDDTVEFALVGEHSAWFGLDKRSENSIALTLLSPIPSAVLANNQKLIFIIEATRPNSDVVARATVVISLIDEVTSDLILGFEQVSYSGTIEDNTLSLEPIILVEGFTEQVSFALLGDLASYFSLARDGPTVRISLRSAIPEDIIPTNRIVILALRASGPQALPAFATIVLAVERTETVVEQLAFAETYYTGLYTEQAGLNFEQHFSLARGYDDTVEFALVGEHSAWFRLDRRSENSIALTLLSPIPSAVLANNQKLIFIIEATRLNSDVVARATVVISLIDEITSDLILGFEQVSYSGTIEDNTLSLEPIILVEGFTEQVSFALLGDLASYFSLSRDGPTVRISLRSAIPEDIIPTNRIVILALRASGPQALPAFATIVLAVERTETAVEQLAFAETYYTGLYTEQAGLNFEQHFSLARGYDDTVEFALVGEHSAWFGLDRRSQNSIALTLLSPIPSAVLANNQKLIFIIEATRPNSDVVARATVIISLIDEITSDLILGFEQVSYSGTIEDNTLSLEPIILVEGFTEQVSFALLGDLASYFSLARDGPTVRISLRSAIPEDIIPTNRIVILALRASGPQALPAFATIVLAVERTETAVEQLAFAETYYTGLYTEQAGLNFEQHFSLARGYDDTVEFALVGEHSAWFGLDRRSENSIALTLLSPIPSAVLANNQKLIFIIEATRPNSDVVARATVVISLIDEVTSDLILGFEQVSYSGTIEDNTLSLEPIILVEGFTEQVSFALLGDLASYFSLARDGPTVRISLRSAIPEDIIPTNRIVILALRASGPQTLPAFATIVLAVERTETVVEQLAFAETYYTGLYTEQAGLNFEQHFSLARGYDDTVEFALVGEHSAWFGLDRRSENSIALTLLSPIPSAVLANNQKLIFIIEATRLNSDVVARATVVISLIDEITSDLILGFEQVSYSGTIEDNTLSLEPIILVEGFTEQVSFALLGDLASYFSLARDGPTVRISLRSAIPEDIIPTNRIVILALRASGPQALPAFATIVLAVERTETVVEQLAFAETYYTGLYTEQAGLNFEQHFSLARGYDDTVEFALVGEHSAWFGLDRRSDNSIALTLLSPIPSAVLANNQKLIFIIEATRPNSDVVARATVIISLIDEITSDLILGFEQVSYSGTIEDNTLSLEPIILVEGFTEQVSFALLGDLASYFSLARDGPTVRISLRSAIPEDIIPTNRIVILALRASGPQALPAFATIVLAVERTETAVEQLAFAETYYTGLYTEQAGLNFEQHFSLARGYDDTVEFALVGEHSAWFGLDRRSENSIALTLLSPIPSAVLANNQKLIFIIEATRPNSDVVARATVVISLIDEVTSDLILGFEQVSYSGTIEDNTLSLEPIILVEGFTEQVSFALLGDLASYFSLARDGPTVRISLRSAIPEDIIPTNRIVILALRASGPQALPAFATIVLAVERTETVVEQLAFAETYYTGLYTEQAGLNFEQYFSLARGYDDNVEFALVGEHSAWFGLDRRSENSIALTLLSPIPSAVLANNQKLIFIIEATRPNSDVVARATVIISLIDEITSDLILGFEQVSYSGTIEDNTLSLEPIILVEGFTEQVSFALLGDLAPYFSLARDGPTVRISLRSAIPEDIIPTNRIVILALRASGPQALPAFATIVLAVERTETAVEQLAFAETYYTGLYTEQAGLNFEQHFSLARGYDDTVEFALVGEHSAWFGLDRRSENSIALTLLSPIPSAVLANNQKLIFIIEATRPNSDVVARATVIISLIDEITSDLILGFEQVSYSGTIEDNTLSLEPIILVEGFTEQVSFALLGDLAPYFSLARDGPTVRISLRSAIPEDIIPTNRIVILALRASGPQALPAFATIVLAVERTETAVEQLAFAETYYTGLYTEQAGLNFEQHFSLARGYDDTVEFALVGEHSAWFGLDRRSENSIALTLLSPIPSAVLANNQKLIFIIEATRLNSEVVARATVVISLIDEITSDLILGFEQVSYSGTIEDNTLSLEPIILVEGFTEQVSFALLGDLAPYFSLARDGPTVRISLRSAIPEDIIPTNRIVILALRASGPQALPAFATIVLAVERTETAVEQLAFAETYYTGLYTEQSGLNFEQHFSLARGYDDTVEFVLVGEHSAWFGLDRRSENSIALTLLSPIPSAVLANNQKLIFIIEATRPNSDVVARATVIISLIDEITSDLILGFEQVSYSGTIEDNTLSLEPIILVEGFTEQVSFALLGDLAPYFSLARDGPTVRISLRIAIPEDIIPTNRIVILALRASGPQALPAFATIVLAVERTETAVEQLAFAETYYTGLYTEQAGLNFEQHFSLARGYDDTVEFALVGEHSAWFGLDRRSENSIALTLLSPIPSAVLANNQKLIFIIEATRPNSYVVARATVVISLIDEITSDLILGFEQVSYSGTIEDNTLSLEPIILVEGFTEQVSFALLGDLAPYFSLARDGPTVRISLRSAIPEDIIPTNRIVILALRASGPQALPAFATIVLAVERTETAVEQLAFAETYYTGLYTEQAGLNFEQHFSLARGYDDTVEFALVGEHSAWFGLDRRSENSIALTLLSPIPSAVLANNQKLIFIIEAKRPNSDVVARATVVISLIDEITSDLILGFEQVSYSGTIEDNTLSLEPIILVEGFTEQVSFALLGDLAPYFSLTRDGPTVRISLRSAIPEDIIPTNRIVILALRASGPQALPAFATIVLAVERTKTAVEQLAFAETYYTGLYTEQSGLNFEQHFSLARGYDDTVEFALVGEHTALFGLDRRSENSIALTLLSPIPSAVLANNRKLIFIIEATKTGTLVTRATIIISLVNDADLEPKVYFDNVLYNGVMRLGNLIHEQITISGYEGSTIEILGQYAELFEAALSDGNVVITSKPSAVLPEISHIALELRAGRAQAVLVIDITESETPVLPTVTFDSSSYVLQVDDSRTGLVGLVQATSDNGESIIYTLRIDNGHLQQRLTVNSGGELRLSAPVTIGEYSFSVVATTRITQVSATAPVSLTVEAATARDDIDVPPLIILDRDEEEPHRNLVVLNETRYDGCTFALSNSWPENQSWLYVDSYGLHALSIDREDESIAFMALSQIQVELILECEGDVISRAKRSVSSNSRTDWLGPYDYGSNKWILTDAIPYNARRSLVNLIVNDINDNTPIFVDKAKEPVAVGYPIAELEDIILPRSLAELKATDADVGENAALVYWSSHDSLAVSPTTGFVHVRNGFNLENDARLVVHATDRNGDGLTGDLELVVKLLEINKIAVVTIRNAFLNDEEKILNDLTKAVGYEIKTLRTVVISEAESSRTKRDTTDTSGATLQLFVYGLIEREPVEVNQLTTDISNNNIATVNVASSVPLEDHLVDHQGQGRDTGLLAATIALSVLLFILIVAIAVWYFLKWRKKKLYKRFSDKSSLASRNESVEQPKQDNVAKPRLNIEDLKRSERKLQERLQVPIVDVTVEPTTSTEQPADAIINMPTPEPQSPIIIQTIDKLKDNTEESEDDDEFGEKKKSRRKSVVTFNENVEKIIHIEDTPDTIPTDDYEVYKL